MATFGQITKDPVAVANKGLAANNAHSCGRASLAGDRPGWATVDNRIEDGNDGLNPTVLLPFRTNGKKTVLGGSFSCTVTGTHCL